MESKPTQDRGLHKHSETTPEQDAVLEKILSKKSLGSNESIRNSISRLERENEALRRRQNSIREISSQAILSAISAEIETNYAIIKKLEEILHSRGQSLREY